MSYTCDQKEYTLIRLTDLRFDERIADMIDERKGVFPDNLLGNLYSTGAFKLNGDRLDSVLKGYSTGLPPIQVKKELGKYCVLNGRHRVCATVLMRGDAIPCEIVE